MNRSTRLVASLIAMATISIAMQTPSFANVESYSSTRKTIEKSLSSMVKVGKIDFISPETSSGLYYIRLTDGKTLISNKNGSFFIFNDNGQSPNIISVKNEKISDALSPILKPYHIKLLKGLQDKITYSAENETASVTIFTDPLCESCQKIHSNIHELTSNGITVHFVSNPVFGNTSFKTMAGILSMPKKDQPAALDRAVQYFQMQSHNKARTAVSMLDISQLIGIPNPTDIGFKKMQKSMAVAKKIGFTGSPGILLSDGSIINGYIDLKNLAKIIIKKQQALK